MGGVEKAIVDRPAAPPLRAGTGLPPAPWLRLRLADGLHVAMARRGAFPVVRLRLVAPAGAETEPRGREGLAGLVAPLLRAGTLRRDAGQLTATAEALGGDLVTGFDWETASLTIDVLRDDLEPALDLLLEAAFQPAFSTAAFSAARRTRLGQLRGRPLQPAVLAGDWLARVLFGPGRYGTSLLGSAAGLGAVGHPDLVAFHAQRFARAGASLIAVGDFDPEGLLRRLEAPALGEAVPARGPRLPEPAPPAGWPERLIVVVDSPHAKLVELQVGQVGVSQEDADLPGLLLLNRVLGGGPGSRLNRDLRQRRGLSYFVHSRFVARRAPGPFFATTCVGLEHAPVALATILDALRRLQDEPVPAGELRTARRALATAVRRSFETHADISDRLSHLETFDLADDHYERGLLEIERIGPEAVLALARRILRPERAVVVAVGPAPQLRRSLARFGAVVEILPAAVDAFPGPDENRNTQKPQGAVPRVPETLPERR